MLHKATMQRLTLHAPVRRDLLFKLGVEAPDIVPLSEDAQRTMLASLVKEIDLEGLAGKKTCRIAHGEHGCVFGDDPASTRI